MHPLEYNVVDSVAAIPHAYVTTLNFPVRIQTPESCFSLVLLF